MTKNKLQKAQSNIYFSQLNEATGHLSKMNDLLDEGVDFDDAFKEAYKEVDLRVISAIDLTQVTLDLCKQGVEHAKKNVEKYRQIKSSFESVSNKQKARIKEAIEEGANLLGTEKEFYLAKNQPRLDCEYDLDTRNISNILVGSIALESMPKEYLIKTELWQVDTKAVKDALKAGYEVKGFSLVESKHVRAKDIK